MVYLCMRTHMDFAIREGAFDMHSREVSIIWHSV